MSQPDALDLYNECLSIVEQTTEDKTAERVLLIACRLLQMADEHFARECELNLATKNDISQQTNEDSATMAWPPAA